MYEVPSDNEDLALIGHTKRGKEAIAKLLKAEADINNLTKRLDAMDAKLGVDGRIGELYTRLEANKAEIDAINAKIEAGRRR
jgi:hypothetical protein